MFKIVCFSKKSRIFFDSLYSLFYWGHF
jgi:hypothetical protein